MTKLVTFQVMLAVSAVTAADDETELSQADIRDAEKNIKAALELWRAEEGFFDGESIFFTEEIYSVSAKPRSSI